MKSVIFTAVLFAAICALAPRPACAQQRFDIYAQQTQSATAVQPPQYSTTDSFEQIKADVDRNAKTDTSPSKHVLYDDSNDGTQSAPQSSKTNAPSVASATGTAAFLARWAPTAGDRAGIAKYLSIVQPQSYTSDHQVGTVNTGIAAWFDKELAGNACVQRRAVDFYTKVGKITAQVNSLRSGLARNVYMESNGRLSAGWLWRTAMASSGGDSGLAMLLIGMCGHDDHDQGGANDSSFTFRDDSDAARRILSYKIEKYTEIRSSLQSQIQQPTVQSKALLGNIDQEVSNLRRAHPFTTIACPIRPSIFFAAESLGKGIDISDALKQEIQTTQNPDHIFDLPAKSYHVYSGAFFACQMIESGMSPRSARLVVSEGAKIYRGIRLCETLTDATIGWAPEGYKSPEDFLLGPEISKKCNDSKFRKENSGLCAFANQAIYYRKTIKDPNELRSKISGIVSTADASVLYRRWYFAGLTQSFGGHSACTDTQIAGPSNLLAPETNGSDTAGFNIFAPYKPRSWSNARYEAAKRKLATWMVDSKWTIAQHTAGAEFAAKNCKARPANESLEQAACRIDAAKTTKPAGAVR